MPELDDEAYLISIWQRAGMFEQGFNGPVSLSATELNTWATRCCVLLSPWEFEVILTISRTYCSKWSRSSDENEPPPFGQLAQDFDRSAVAKKISNNFKAFIAASKKR